MQPTRSQAYPIGTVCRWTKTNQFVLITGNGTLNDSENGFLNYLGIIEGRGLGTYALYHDDLILESLPDEHFNMETEIQKLDNNVDPFFKIKTRKN